MWTLALDVDGVLLDPERRGRGHWSNELEVRFGITRAQLRDAFFSTSWSDVVNGRSAIEEALGEALEQIGADVDVESVLECWFAADHVPFDETFDVANRAADVGCRIVLATNQEHRRAAYLAEHIGARMPLAAVLYSADVGHQKHDRRFFEIASERLSVPADQRHTIVFVDDAEANVEVARSAGWHAVHATTDSPWLQTVEQLLQISS